MSDTSVAGSMDDREGAGVRTAMIGRGERTKWHLGNFAKDNKQRFVPTKD